MGTHRIEYEIFDSAGQKMGFVPVTRVTKARGTAIFVTSSSVKQLIGHFMHRGVHPDSLSNPQTCLKVLTMLIFKWTAAREHVLVCKTQTTPSVCITIDYRDGQRRDAGDEAIHFTEPPDDDEVQPCITLGPILLRWAVQSGAVEEGSLTELRRTMAAPSFSHVEWTHPNRPVLCAIGQDGELQHDTPAQAHHLESYVRAITRDVPALHDMKCSALRWGAIYEAWEMGRVDAALAMLDECEKDDLES
ncbi:hypothetical protein CEP52_005464 [Fusarium oligoseptatum]|uniref:Uncharacterized protein n=1 Tax=Fusarium oligoseptatum TaxID=2604345 RepID=A0A428TY06_9HYPO|nr:hypothetical protein CEP52_005464 [Fusarium oligoseptatum]